MNKLSKCMRGIFFALMFLVHSFASAFVGSDFEAGKSYYLFNIYQGRFLNAESKLDNANAAKFAVNAGSMTIAGKSWTLSKNASGYYQLKNAGKFLAFEDKVVDVEASTDENRAKYLGGGVTCQPSANDTDRSYWMLISEEEYAEWMGKKKFTVASLNVDGMPKSVSLAGNEISLNPDAKEEAGGIAIGKRLLNSGFDVVGVSEDFNYHSNIMDEAGSVYADMTHRGIISVGNANLLNYLSQRPLFDTDGLGLFYKKGILTPSAEKYVQWNDHYGYTDSGADGLIKKGYRYYLITLADGTEIDLYTMHMDAESSAEDNAARAKQLTQLVTAIKATDNKRPIIIIGDTNCRYTRDKLKELLIDAINADERFTIRDPWILYGRNNTYPGYGSGSIMASSEGYLSGEVVDKIFYINNKESNIRLVAETYCQDLSFVDEEGSPLCDHKPCVVTFSYHEYDAETDDKPVIETTDEAVYLRNRETGRYLMNGGWWGSHAVVGNYGKDVFIKSLPNGKYDISTKYGHITDAAYVDNNNEAEYIKEWTILEQDGYKVLAYNQGGTMKALTADDPTYFDDNPLYRYVTTAPLNVNDKLQQWEIVTKAIRDAEIASATPNNPVNVTHLVKSANFDRIDWGEHGEWKFTNNASSYVTDNGIGGADNHAFCNYNRSISTKTYGTITRNNTWDLYQTLNVKPGYYIVTCQGFVQEGNNNSQNVKFYAWSNPEGSQVMNSQVLKSYLSEESNLRPTSGNQSSAAEAFNQGLYTNELPVMKVGADGVLVIGAKKDVKTKSNTTWTVFDNFQLYYLGTEEPTETVYDYDVIASTKKAELNADETAWNVSGTWRLVDMSALNSKLATNPRLLVDASEATIIGRPSIPVPSDVPNMMIKVNRATDIANNANVIDAENECANLVITDKKDFAPGMEFNAKTVSYARSNTLGYNTVCLPFEVKAADFPESCTLYALNKITEGTVVFREVEDDETIEAGCPIIVSDEIGDDWLISIADTRSVVADAQISDEEGLQGSFVKQTIGEGYFKLNTEGTKFVSTTATSTVTPYRFYVKANAVGMGKSLMLSLADDGATSLDAILSDPQTSVQATYDLTGKKVINISHPGIYIKGGKKVFIK